MLVLKLWSVFQKRGQAEAINGALAMVGLTAGLIVEGQTGKGILGQVLKTQVDHRVRKNSVCEN
jgi:hypothetical protein